MEILNAVDILGSLAQETRLGAFRRLVAAGREGLSAGELAEALGVPSPTLSFHLSQLSRSGLIRGHREGRSIRYAIEVNVVRELIGFLVDDCCGGDAALCGLSIAQPSCCVESPA